MKKIPSLFKRDYEGTRQVYDEVVEGSEWVIEGEGVATVKHDGTACMVRDNKLYKRFDRKKNKKTGEYKDAPNGWEPCEDAPNEHTGHWPGWVPVGDGPEDKWHREAFSLGTLIGARTDFVDGRANGTYELVGPKVQGNPYDFGQHTLVLHGLPFPLHIEPPRGFDDLRNWFEQHDHEGIVWWHLDGRMVKIKRKDFGLSWPAK